MHIGGRLKKKKVKRDKDQSVCVDHVKSMEKLLDDPDSSSDMRLTCEVNIYIQAVSGG